MHPYAQHSAEKNSRERARQITKGYARGGDIAQDAKMVMSGVGQHERAMHAGKTPTKLKLPTVAEGASARQRLDRAPRARGGRAKKATTVNVMVNPPPAAPAGVAGPMLADAPVPMPPAAPPPGPPMMPPRPPMAGPGGPPMMRARGGRASGGGIDPTEDGSAQTKGRDDPRAAQAMGRARGGRTYDAGAGTGESRLEKRDAYGANAKIKDTTKAVKGPKGEGK